MCRKIWEWENRHNIPYAKRLTEWYGDLGMHVPLPGITDEQIRRRYKNISMEATAQTSPVRGMEPSL